MAISGLRIGQGLADKEYMPQLCIPTFFNKAALTAISEAAR